MGRIPSLDGLRAVSIGMVIISHASTTTLYPHQPGLGVILLGKLGVSFFFVISGFLITTLLLQERARRQQISLPHFYLRRCLRLMPALTAYLMVTAGLMAGGYWEPAWLDLGQTALYLKDLHLARLYGAPESFATAHTWSLALEEQFYLLWPALLALLGLPRARWWAVAVFVAAPLVAMLPLSPHLLRALAFLPYAGYLAIGCLMAGDPDTWRRLGSPRNMVVAAAYLAVCTAWPDTAVAMMADWGRPLAVGVIVAYATTRPASILGAWLNLRPMVFMGQISYSLYLWQQLFLETAHRNWLTAFPLNLVWMAGTALASYYLIESPFLTLKDRLARRNAPNPEVRPDPHRQPISSG